MDGYLSAFFQTLALVAEEEVGVRYEITVVRKDH